MPVSLRAAFVAVILAAVVCGHADRAIAGVFKCISDSGAPVYQDSPCPPGKELRNFDTDPAEVSVIPFRAVPGTSTTQSSPQPAKAPAGGTAAKKTPPVAGIDIGQRKFIVPGMSEGEVISRIGSPDMTSGGKGRKTSRWSYLPTAGDPQTITTLVFDYGKVIEVERKVVK